MVAGSGPPASGGCLRGLGGEARVSTQGTGWQWTAWGGRRIPLGQSGWRCRSEGAFAHVSACADIQVTGWFLVGLCCVQSCPRSPELLDQRQVLRGSRMGVGAQPGTLRQVPITCSPVIS